MKVIFLDIDGVMNSQVFYKQRHYRRWRKPITYWYELKRITRKILGIKSKGVSLVNYKIPDHHYEFPYQFDRLTEETCREKWEWLSEFCNDNDVKICISSTWKHHFGDKEYRLKSEQCGDALKLLGFKTGTFVGITPNKPSRIRGEEIKAWLDNHPEVVDYAILDDDSDMLPEQMKKFHHCDGWFGMSPNHLYRIERQFQGKSNYEKLTKSVYNEDDM
jgi:hypothetical protein